MNKFVVSAVVFSLLMSAAPVMAQSDVLFIEGTSVGANAETEVTAPRDRATGQASGKRTAVEVKAECRAKCEAGSTDTPDLCVARCVAAANAAVNVVSPRDAASGLPTGKRQHKPMTIIKEWDAATPILMKRAEERRGDLASRREEMKTKMEEQREKLKERLAEFKNKTKASIAERIAESLRKLNERLTTHFASQIDKLEEIMVRVATGDVDGDGTADITAANQAIADADAAVSAQASETYTVEVSVEANVKVDVGAARKQLHDDLKAVEEKMKAARVAVRKAATHVDAEAAINLNSSRSN